MIRSSLAALAALVTLVGAGLAEAQEFSYDPPGQLVPGSGEGRVDSTVYAPGMRFPIESAPAFPNSQVWGVGGSQGPAGSQCDIANFSYPWHDNYCEERSWDMPLCPAGTGHQGQDIRAATCDPNVHWVVAVADGEVTHIGSYTLYITAADGTRFDYLHTDSQQVVVGDTVTKGQRIAKVSNQFDGTPTTVHCHFNIQQNVDGVGTVFVPPYMSLVQSYQNLIGPGLDPVEGALDEVSCTGIRGWTAAPEDQATAIEARLYFDGGPGGAAVPGHPLLADRNRPDLCGTVGCDHGFETGLPLSLLDGAAHDVRAFGTRGLADDQVELAGSPKSFTCGLEIPEGLRRSVVDAAAETAWRFSDFWDVASVSQGIVDGIEPGPDLPAVPRVVATDEAPDDLWLVDGDVRRHVPDATVAAAWDFYPDLAEHLDPASLDALPEGPEVRTRPFVLRGPDGAAYLIDDLPDAAQTGAGGGLPGTGGGQPTGAGAGGDDPGDEPASIVGAGSGGSDAAEGDGSGCSCRLPATSSDAPGSRAAFAVALGAALFAARSRRRSRCRQNRTSDLGASRRLA